MKEGTSVDQHLKHMKDITDKLAAIDPLFPKRIKL